VSHSVGSLPLVEELRPVPTVWQVVRGLADQPYLLALDSALLDSPLAQYSFVTAGPLAWLEARGPAWSVRLAPTAPPTLDPPPDRAPLEVVGEWLAAFRLDAVPGLPPFQGGVAGLWGYELAGQFERLPRAGYDEFALPDLAVGLYPWVIAFDHRHDRAWLVVCPWPSRDQAGRTISRLRALLARAPESVPLPSLDGAKLPPARLAPQYPLPGWPGVTSSFSPEGFRSAIARAIDYVHAGDCFQVNLAQRLLAPAQGAPLELYQRLRTRNPAPLAGLLWARRLAVLSASPERFVQVRGGQVLTRPIKGTRPRGATPEADAALAAELCQSPKDRAENVMIVDLLRNDLGRVCAFGSVQVPRVCALESYRHVHHLVSEVCGRLRPGLGALDLLRASFPGGSVTGAPKVRAMQIIAELEPTVRGPYCGCLGYIGFDGDADFSILIRTITQAHGWLQFPVGGGLVADSEPASEYAETLTKARGMLNALTP
jgi:para-aminobenzoate synthetase component 1